MRKRANRALQLSCHTLHLAGDLSAHKERVTRCHIEILPSTKDVWEGTSPPLQVAPVKLICMTSYQQRPLGLAAWETGLHSGPLATGLKIGAAGVAGHSYGTGGWLRAAPDLSVLSAQSAELSTKLPEAA